MGGVFQVNKFGYSEKTCLLIITVFTYCSFCGIPTALADSDATSNLQPNFFVQDPTLELGYLNPIQARNSRTNPYAADSKVTASQMNAANFPLTTNPAEFDDEFNPAEYSKWQVVQLSPATGATCGDGSPYKFFANRRPKTTNMLLYFEPGGACADYESCSGTTGIRGARNPNGIPDNYLESLGTNSVSPLISRGLAIFAPNDYVETVDWSTVYIPYCTGDIYSGDKVAAYENPKDPNENIMWSHNGIKNVRAVLAWLKENLPKPPQMLATGCSAGGVGSLTNYAHIRNDLNPIKSFLLNDSGPVFSAPESCNRADHPSLPLHHQIRESWGLDDGMIPYLSRLLPDFDPNNMGTMYAAMAHQFPDDRMGFTQFWGDKIFSSYSYERSHPEMALGNTLASRYPLLRSRWYQDTANLISELDGHENFGYYIPRQRNFNESHCTTIVSFHNTEIDERGLTVKDFIVDLLDGTGSILEASETDTYDPSYFSLALWIAGMGLPGPSTVQALDEPVVIEFSNSFTGQGFGSIEPGSNAVTLGANHNNKWIVSPNEQTKFLRFVNLNTGKTLNNEAFHNPVAADNLIPNVYWSSQWALEFTTTATNEFVLGARHGKYVYLNNDANNQLRTQHSSNIFRDTPANKRSKWKYSAKFLSDLDPQQIQRTRDIVFLKNRQSGSVLYDPGLNVADIAKYSRATNISNTKWVVQNIAASEKHVRLVNADTNRSLNLEKANGELQLGDLPVGYWSANWRVDVTSPGHASFENRWRSRKHRFYVPGGKTSGIVKEARLNQFDPRAEWTFQPAYEVLTEYELIPTQSQ